MSVNTKTILSTTVYGVPSGNYDGSSQDFVSDAQPAADYYHGRGGIQTLDIRVTDFSGQIVIEATLNDSADTATWFSVYEYGESSTASQITDYHPVTLTGNFTWLRVSVRSFDAGTIDSVRVTY